MAEPVLAHYGVKRRSGRYPWGSGKDPMQSGRHLLGHVDNLRRQGLTEKQIADGLNITTTQLRAKLSIAKNEHRAAQAAQAVRLSGKGMSNVAIGRQMGIPESSVRNLLNPANMAKRDSLTTTADRLKGAIKDGGYLDIGKGTENWIGISSTKLSTAVALLKEQGYEVRSIQVPQLGTGMKTTVKVLAPPGTGSKFIHPSEIKTLAAYSEDGGKTYTPIKPPISVDSKRIAVRYGGQGGENADGIIYVRPGVNDLSLGASRYSQVRIAVDNSHYLKGMAMYKEGLPPGVDLMFNTTAKPTGNKLDAMKPFEGPPEAPFKGGLSSIRKQRTYTDPKGRQRLSPMNIVNEEGDWRTWRPTLSSQVLSKQPTSLAKRQLGAALDASKRDLAEIRDLTNPVIKQRLLATFADQADSDAVSLKAAAMPGQKTHVILPFSGIKENQIYAPNYKNGDQVVLIRHPHGGTFEIPTLTVNNRNAEARRTIGPGVAGRKTGALDAVGIHPNVAKRLSGADFDGDAVLVIPNRGRDIKTSSALSGLANFDPATAYPGFPGMKRLSEPGKQQLMGDVSNLITDMTIKAAKPEEIAAAVRHSMVVIDAAKKGLNYKQSYEDNGIQHLKEKYQGGKRAGASTIVSRAGSKIRIPQRTPQPMRRGGPIDPVTGKKIFEPTGKSFIDPGTGKRVVRQIVVKRLAEEADARSLLSDNPTPMERIYADHSNSLKSLANQARLESLRTGGLKYSPSAAKTYAHQVSRLNSALQVSLRNAPLERQAQIIANALTSARINDNPGVDSDTRKKWGYQELQKARARVGAKKHQIVISQDEWHAIQAGAITTNKLRQIISNSDIDQLRALATPRQARVMNTSMLSRAKVLLDSGHTQADVAAALGVPVSTLNTALIREEAKHGLFDTTVHAYDHRQSMESMDALG